jgi:hypothetical protein
MGIERRAEVKSTLELGWKLPATAGALVVVGTDGGHTCRFVLTGPPEHQQLVRYDKNGQATTARPAMREEDWLFTALTALWTERRELDADLRQALTQINVQEGLLRDVQAKNDEWYGQVANQAGQIELLLDRPTAEDYQAILSQAQDAQAQAERYATERDRERLEKLEALESNETLRTGIKELQERLARCEAEKAGQLRLDVEGK